MPRLHPLSEVRVAIERYLAKIGPKFPKSLVEVMSSGKFHPLHEVGLLETSTASVPEEDPIVKQLEADEARMRTAYLAAMDELRIDALAFPTATYPPKLNGDRNTTPAGMLSGIASALHWPAAVVPMGYSHESLPSGLQLLGRPWSDPLLNRTRICLRAGTLDTASPRLRFRHSGISWHSPSRARLALCTASCKAHGRSGW